MKKLLLGLFLLKVVFLSAQSLEHPVIWTTPEEKPEVLSKIQNHSWASAIVSQVKGIVDSKVNSHVTNPEAFLNTIPALAADDNVSEADAGSAIAAHASILNHASYAAMIYYISGEEKYAQFSADVLWYYIEQIAPRRPDNTAMSGNYFADLVRGIYNLLSLTILW
ncbi:hypothetical protein [Jejuia pallidilutea]|uniref:Uncharacterized protein n=1 Tax=Jejuia pallidilutea TaxID=504487 RepID=A0A090WB69_9FLAO|nr:hypothetical protein [Jejuia pallidilutea]GAL72679.1 hypothetical protein JCM19302_2339 [Jejuia pallidilutea]